MVLKDNSTGIVPCTKYCQDDENCFPWQKCEVQTQTCYNKTCTDQIDHGYVARKDNTTVIHCHKGYLINLNGKVVKEAEVECRYNASELQLIWVSNQTKVKCITGCLDESDCGTDYKCVDNKCQIMTCTAQLSIPDSNFQFAELEINSALNFTCNKGYVSDRRAKKEIKLSCIEDEGTGNVKWSDYYGGEVEKCVPGCVDCLDCSDGSNCDHPNCIEPTCERFEDKVMRMDCLSKSKLVPPGEQCNLTLTAKGLIFDRKF